MSIDAGEDGLWDVCLVCFWENGGDGPNQMELRVARDNFERHGAMSPRHVVHVEPDGRRKYMMGPPLVD